MNEFMARMPELGSSEVSAENEKPTLYELKRKELEKSTDYYDQLAWFVFKWITSRAWFEAFIMCNIALIGVATGVDLQFAAVKDPTITQFVDTVSNVTAIIFTVECGLKLIAESYRFERYFTDEENGQFNTFDFVIVGACVIHSYMRATVAHSCLPFGGLSAHLFSFLGSCSRYVADISNRSK